MKNPVAGDIAVSYCTKCKLNLSHKITTLVANKIGKVECCTCGATHKYKYGGSTKTSQSKTRKKKSTTKSQLTQEEYEALWAEGLLGAKGLAINYDMKKTYMAGDIILHKTFGKGIVGKLSYQYFYVRFKDKERCLAMSIS